MYESELISVIVPVYKVELYLEKCIQSIQSQTYQNLEIILVDDGSPDACPSICDKYAKTDKRICVIHQENGGLSNARNTGLNAAHGDYIAFVDSDDYIHPEMLNTLYRIKKDTHSDIAACKYAYVSTKSGPINTTISSPPSIKIYENDAILYEFFTFNSTFSAVVWNKLYDKTLLNNLRFPINTKHEDEYLSHKVLLKAKRLTYVDEVLYYYLQRANSIMSSYNLQMYFDKYNSLSERINDFKQYHHASLAWHTRLKLLSALIRDTKVLIPSPYRSKYLTYLFKNLFLIIFEFRPMHIKYLYSYFSKKKHSDQFTFQ